MPRRRTITTASVAAFLAAATTAPTCSLALVAPRQLNLQPLAVGGELEVGVRIVILRDGHGYAAGGGGGHDTRQVVYN